MTDVQIVKALRCFSIGAYGKVCIRIRHNKVKTCEQCKFYVGDILDGIGNHDLARMAADTIERLTAEAGRISLAEEEKDTMMKRRKEQIEVIRTRIDKGGLCDVEKRLLNDLNLPSNYDRRSCTPRTEGYKDD